MPQGRVTKRSVDALSCPPGKDRAFLWDDDLAGFGVAAFASGRKVYVAQYRQNGRSRRSTIGDHGRLTPDQARSEAKKLLGAVERGADPVEERRVARGIRTFDKVADDWMAQHVNVKRKPRTRAYYDDVLRLHIRPALGGKRMADIGRADLARLHARMALKSATANRALAIVSGIWNWALKHGEAGAGDNPAKGIERFSEEGRERFLSTEELGRIGTALQQAEAGTLVLDRGKPKAKHARRLDETRHVDPYAVAAMRLLILTGARLREVLHAEWSDVDFERGLLNLPAARSKSGKKSIYLSAAALAVLSALPRLAGNPHIIVGVKKGSPRADLKKPWALITEAAGLAGVRLHDMRHTYASLGAGASLGLPIIGKLLGHAQPATTQRYAHLDADPLRRAVDTISATIEAAMGAQSSCDVVSIVKAKSWRRPNG